MTMSDRGLHPDLVDDEQSAPSSPPETSGEEQTPSSRNRARTARRAAAPPSAAAPAAEPTPAAPDSEPASAESAQTPQPAEAEAAAEPPEWRLKLKEAVEAGDDSAIQRLLNENRPDIVSGHIGQIVRRQREKEAREAIEQQKREALANADFYGLGQLAAPEVRQQLEQAQLTSSPFMEGVTLFQSKLSPEVQAEVQGKSFGVGKSHAEGVAEYLEAVHQAALRHGQERSFEQELKRREPALRKAWLSETNGAQPVPELDGGRAGYTREVTGAQVEAMSAAEYAQYFDDNGKPKPGVRYLQTDRDVPLTRR